MLSSDIRCNSCGCIVVVGQSCFTSHCRHVVVSRWLVFTAPKKRMRGSVLFISLLFMRCGSPNLMPTDGPMMKGSFPGQIVVRHIVVLMAVPRPSRPRPLPVLLVALRPPRCPPPRPRFPLPRPDPPRPRPRVLFRGDGVVAVVVVDVVVDGG